MVKRRQIGQTAAARAGREETAEVGALDYEGRGIARVHGKAVFIRGALPGEQVVFRIRKEGKSFDEADCVRVLRPSEQRVEPVCGHFGHCGGCTLQYARPEAQVAYKQRVAEEQLQRIGKVRPECILPPLYGLPWHYRQRGRLSVSVGAGRLKLGFQADGSHEVVDIDRCPVLPETLSDALPVLKNGLTAMAEELGLRFIEFAVGHRVTALNLVCSQTPAERHRQILARCRAELPTQTEWQFWLQTGRTAARPLLPEQAGLLSYRLPAYGLEMPYHPGDFTQVNEETNVLMVQRALQLLMPQKGERIADLFCGLGNFTLPLAQSGAKVVGIEGSAMLTERARANARQNGCAQELVFQTADLLTVTPDTVSGWGYLDKMLLDPPRAGAYAVVQALHRPYLPKRVVYVSCNPATLARDAGVLVAKGYRFRAFGILNLFSQTAHIESLACFELGG